MKELEYNQFYISGFQIRRIRSQGEWRYSLRDVIAYLTKSKNPTMYIQIRFSRDKELFFNMQPYMKKFLLPSEIGNRMINCANLYGLWYVTKSLPNKYRWRVRNFRSWIE